MDPMLGIVAITDHGWYDFLRAQPRLDEVNFWKPSAYRGLNAPEFSPFFFKLNDPRETRLEFREISSNRSG